jgi:PilZ domain
MSERRTVRRMKSFLRGLIYFDGRPSGLSCIIRDLNEQGAHVILAEAVALPYVINLYIANKEQTLRARVSWRRGDEIGLSFGVKPADLPDAATLMQRVAQLEAENDKLRRTIRRLKRSENQPLDDGVAA